MFSILILIMLFNNTLNIMIAVTAFKHICVLFLKSQHFTFEISPTLFYHLQAGGYYCECEPGWSGQQCNQRDPACSPNTCAHGGTCTLLAGQADPFHCDCPPGFTGNNKNSVKCIKNKNTFFFHFYKNIFYDYLFYDFIKCKKQMLVLYLNFESNNKIK